MGWGRATVEESFYMCIRIDSISIVAGLRSSYTFIVTCCDKYSYDENWWLWREFIWPVATHKQGAIFYIIENRSSMPMEILYFNED